VNAIFFDHQEFRATKNSVYDAEFHGDKPVQSANYRHSYMAMRGNNSCIFNRLAVINKLIGRSAYQIPSMELAVASGDNTIGGCVEIKRTN